MFVDDDDAYLAWTRRNPGGFVLNCHRKPNADYLMLHRSFCQTITEPGSQATTWTMHDYIKVCSTDRNKVKAWATEQTDGKVTLCQTCW